MKNFPNKTHQNSPLLKPPLHQVSNNYSSKPQTLNYIDDHSFIESHRGSEVNFLTSINKINPRLEDIDFPKLRSSFMHTKTKINLLKNLEKTRKSTFNEPQTAGYCCHSENDIENQETDEEFVCAIRDHNNSRILLHCTDCDLPLCLQCMKTHHQDKKKHEYIEIQELQEKISREAIKHIELLEERVQNLEPEFNLEEIQQSGLKAIYESKEKLIKIIDGFYEELINSYKSLTFKKPIQLQKTGILDKQKELVEALREFKNKDFNINLIAKYFRSEYTREIKELEENITSFQKKIKKEFRRLPSIKNNVDVLKEIQDLLLNYVNISFGNQPVESLTRKNTNSNMLASTMFQTRNVIEAESYFKTKRKYLHQLFPLEKRLFLYDIDTHKSILYPLKTNEIPLPLYSSTIFTPELDLYILGGLSQKSQKYSKKVLKYDKELGLIKLPTLLEKKMAFGICFMKGMIYIFGGKGNNNQKLDLCERFSIKNNKWEPIGRMKEKRSSPGVCNFNDEKIYVFFGVDKDSSCNFCDVIEKYSIKKNAWSSVYVINWLNGLEMSQITCHQINSNQILLLGGVNRFDTEEETAQKFYTFSRRMMLFDVQDRNLENLGESLPEGSLNLGQSFIDNDSFYSLRTVRSSKEGLLENCFSVLKVNDVLKASVTNIVNCKDVGMLMKLQKKHDKME